MKQLRTALLVLALLTSGIGCAASKQAVVPIPTKRFSIADVIQEVREQLREAERRVRESGAKGLFKGRDFELTLHFGIVDSTEVKGELDIVLAKMGAKKTYIDETAQTIRITFDIDPSLSLTR